MQEKNRWPPFPSRIFKACVCNQVLPFKVHSVRPQRPPCRAAPLPPQLSAPITATLRVLQSLPGITPHGLNHPRHCFGKVTPPLTSRWMLYISLGEQHVLHGTRAAFKRSWETTSAGIGAAGAAVMSQVWGTAGRLAGSELTLHSLPASSSRCAVNAVLCDCESGETGSARRAS